MSDVDDPNGILVRGPWRSEPSYTLPPIPDFIDTIPPPEVLANAKALIRRFVDEVAQVLRTQVEKSQVGAL
ncbi:hypothetical protein, partial [Streptomyces sp. NPDC002692]